MARKRKRGPCHPVAANALTEPLGPESRPPKYYSRLEFASPEEGHGPLGIVGRELQLVWYQTEKDRDRDRHGSVVSVLEFRDCWRNRGPLGDRYHFKAFLLEDMSGEYREWVDHQVHRGRAWTDAADVLETEVHFSVGIRQLAIDPFSDDEPPLQPFVIHTPDVQDLSSPQLDMLFDAMSHLFQNMPAMMLMEDLQRQRTAGPECEQSPGNASGDPGRGNATQDADAASVADPLSAIRSMCFPPR